jgi:2-polyprenyl-3-methyl-5-hydroxy-6-metoxy-1,4-benzoquinol methylase
VAYELHRDPRSSHQRIARRLRALQAEPILDVGASSGQLGILLADTKLAIDAIEPDAPSAAEAAPHYRSVQRSTVEDAVLPRATYRAVVCADVLEHLHDPDAQLRRLVSSATEDATIIISVPNVAHAAARLLVLAGKFPRHPRGIFDRTHRHFYTRETLMEMVARAGLEVTSIEVTPVPLEDVWPTRWPFALREGVMRLQSFAGRIAPRLFGFQWVVTARRASPSS